jgi:hypothetical protein
MNVLLCVSYYHQVFPPARRPRDFRDSTYESRRTSQFTGGISLENFRFISVLGRGHFGKVSFDLLNYSTHLLTLLNPSLLLVVYV